MPRPSGQSEMIPFDLTFMTNAENLIHLKVTDAGPTSPRLLLYPLIKVSVVPSTLSLPMVAPVAVLIPVRWSSGQLFCPLLSLHYNRESFRLAVERTGFNPG